MAKKFSVLQEQLYAKMTPEQLAKSDELYQQMLSEIEQQAFEPDIIEWLKQQDSTTKHYVNEMVRNVMKMHMQSIS